MKLRDYEADQKFADDFTERKDVQDLIRDEFDAVSVVKASPEDDIKGTDFWVTLKNGRRYSIDAKVRREDCRGWNYRDRYGRDTGVAKDDLALEMWDEIDKKIGWTRDPSKHTDFIVWFWEDTGRYLFVQFQFLRAIFLENYDAWTAPLPDESKGIPLPNGPFQVAPQYNKKNGRKYTSLCVFVPRKLILRLIQERKKGHIAPKSPSQLSLPI